MTTELKPVIKKCSLARDAVKNTNQDNALPMEKHVQNVKDKTIMQECVSLRKKDKEYTQCRKKLMTAMI